LKTVKIITYVGFCNAMAIAGAWGLTKLEILPEYEKEFFGTIAVIILCAALYNIRMQNKNSKIEIKFSLLKLKQARRINQLLKRTKGI
jgi:hypothetical protein